MKNLFKGYWRNLVQSQENHVEIMGEKNAIFSIIQPIAQQYTLPLTISRGMCSLPPKRAIAKRFMESGKSKLFLLLLTDLDPAGEAIAEDVPKSLIRDFHVPATRIVPIKVALTSDQVTEYHLPPSMDAKKSSPTYRSFVDKYGTDAYELEALHPEQLQEILRNAIRSVLNLELFNQQLEHEKNDSIQIAAFQERALAHLGQLPISESNGE